MKTRNVFTKLSMVIALIALASTVTMWEVRRVRAEPPPDPDRTSGMVGITPGQTMRLNVVNLNPPPDPGTNGVPPGPCRVVLSFRNADGQPFTDSNGQVVGREVSLQPGESAFLDLNGDLFAPPATNAQGAPGAARLQLRPFVRALSTPPDPELGSAPPGPCFPSMEVFDNTNGRTSLFSAGFHPPPDPDRGQ